MSVGVDEVAAMHAITHSMSEEIAASDIDCTGQVKNASDPTWVQPAVLSR